MVQTVRHPGLSLVDSQFLSDVEGSQIYVREEARLVGTSIQQLTYAFPKAVLLGLVRPVKDDFQATLNPPNRMRVEAGDRIAVLAPSDQDAAPPETINAEVELPEKPAPEYPAPGHRRVLMLGWNHRVPALLSEFTSYPKEQFAIDIVSQVSAAKREKRIAALELSPERLRIRHLDV